MGPGPATGSVRRRDCRHQLHSRVTIEGVSAAIVVVLILLAVGIVVEPWNRCRGPGCRNLIEIPFAHCCLACEGAEKRDLEARKRPRPKAPPTLSVTEAHQVLGAGC